MKTHFKYLCLKKIQWYNEIFNLMNFELCNCPLKILESIGILVPKMGAHLGVWEFIPSLSYNPKNMKCDFQASLLAHTFTSLGLGREPKARVATFCNLFIIILKNIIFNYFSHPFHEWVFFLYFITFLQLFYN